MLGTGLARQGVERRCEDVEIALDESMMEIITPMEGGCAKRGIAFELAPSADYAVVSWA